MNRKRTTTKRQHRKLLVSKQTSFCKSLTSSTVRRAKLGAASSSSSSSSSSSTSASSLDASTSNTAENLLQQVEQLQEQLGSSVTAASPEQLTLNNQSQEDDDDDEDECVVSQAAMESLKNAATSDAASLSNSLSYLKQVIPNLTLLSAMGFLVTAFLAPYSTAAAQGVKLVFAGAVAGILSRTACAPIEMVSTVMMCRGSAECGSMTTELGNTWRAEGLKGMFKGNGANCLKVAPSRGTQFLVYEFLKRQMVLAGFGVVAATSSLNAGARLVAGGVAGMIAASLVYPLEVVKTMLTLYPEECGGTVPGAIRKVFSSGGVGALYRGLGPTLVAMFPYVGVEFMVYETLKKRWEVAFGPVGTASLLVFGALSGAAAQASAHPLDVIRRRMQMQTMNKKKTKVNGDSSSKTKKQYSNMFSGLYRVQKEEGMGALFNGLGPACLEKIPSTAIGYFIYEAMKRVLQLTSV
mmetsp:Transcript_6722/g.18827  ORF Transcript_6722/g.18827 Transcript_6722/m.18827 type:complete len:466 (+) Transcript_6722:1288-2685(+)